MPCLCGKEEAAAQNELSAARRLQQQRRRLDVTLVGCAPMCAPPTASADLRRVGLLRAHVRMVRRRGDTPPPAQKRRACSFATDEHAHAPFCTCVCQPDFVPRLVAGTAAGGGGEMVEILRELISIPSVNPDQVRLSGVSPLDDPNCGEHAIATALAEKLRAVGAAEVIVEDCTASWSAPVEGFGPRSNVYGIWRSKDPAAKWIGIDTHIDTVMVNGMQPFGAFDATQTPDGKIHGRGSCDTKATFAIMITILGELQAAGRLGELPVNLVLAGTCGEETGRLGANYFREYLLRRQIFLSEMLVAEPTLCTPITGHKGGVGLRLEIKGVAAHSSKPHLGKNALVAAAEVTSRFYAEHERLQRERKGPLGPPTITPTLGGGGHGPNIVPQDAFVHLDYRVTTAGETDTASEDTEQVRAWMLSVAHEVLDNSIHCTGFEASDGGIAGGPSFFQDPADPWVQRLAAWSGLPAEVVTFGTNATAYSQPAGTGIEALADAEAVAAVAAVGAAGGGGSDEGEPVGGNAVYGSCVVMGPGDISQAHMADEWVEISQLVKMKGILTQWLGVA
eukprot:SAG22_NODE_522_length_9503_cov_4.233624_4_plen_563_part_00